jgi:hypothetical protein
MRALVYEKVHRAASAGERRGPDSAVLTRTSELRGLGVTVIDRF